MNQIANGCQELFTAPRILLPLTYSWLLKQRRVLIVVEERYVVALEERKEEKTLEFISAFPVNESYLEKIRQESALMEIKKPQS